MSAGRTERALAPVLAALSGVAVFLAYPDWDIHQLAWVALVPLLIGARNATPRRGFLLGLLAGTITNVGGFHWITQMLRDFGHLPAVVTWTIVTLGGMGQGLAMAVGVGTWRWLVARGAPVGFSAFVCMWVGEAVTPMVFPWFMGNAIAHETLFVQVAELGGVHAVSALLFATNAAVFELIDSALSRRWPAGKLHAGVVSAVLFAAAFGWWRIGVWEAREATAPKLRIGLVEGDIGIWEKQAKHLHGIERVRTLRNNLVIHQQMSAELQKQGVDLILWPESAYMPYGPAPVLYTKDRFAAVGDGGRVLRHDGTQLVPIGARRGGLPNLQGKLSGLCSPRGDVLRMVADGREVITVAPWATRQVQAPEGETIVDTAVGVVDMFGAIPRGVVASRSGRLWSLAFDDEPVPGDKPAVDAPELIEVPGHQLGAVDINAVGVSGTGATWMVGRGGAMLRMMGQTVQRHRSPTSQDLWDIAGDALGSELVAVGSNGTILSVLGEHVGVQTHGGKNLYAVWLGPDGAAWAAGEQGTLLKRRHGGRWRRIELHTGGIDLHAGASDADGGVLVLGARGAWSSQDGLAFAPVAGPIGTLADVIGFHAKASYTIPRSAKRILPARSPLPSKDTRFPDNIIADERLGEFERNTPRRGFDAPLLFGALTYGGVLPRRNSECRACYNSALLIDGQGGIIDTTDKAFLLVFGEYLPFGERYPELYDLLPEGSRFQPGTRTRPLALGMARIGVLICYEDLLPRQSMKVAAHDPNVFVNLTNDAWFGDTAEPYHHLQLAQMRSIEYRRWLVRSTNTGVSVFIDALGRRRKETATTGAETLVMSVPLLEGRTMYAMLGDWPLLLLAIAMLVLVGRALRGTTGGKGSKPRKKAAPPAKKPAPPAKKPAPIDNSDAPAKPARKPPDAPPSLKPKKLT